MASYTPGSFPGTGFTFDTRAVGQVVEASHTNDLLNAVRDLESYTQWGVLGGTYDTGLANPDLHRENRTRFACWTQTFTISGDQYTGLTYGPHSLEVALSVPSGIASFLDDAPFDVRNAVLLAVRYRDSVSTEAVPRRLTQWPVRAELRRVSDVAAYAVILPNDPGDIGNERQSEIKAAYLLDEDGMDGGAIPYLLSCLILTPGLP